MLCPSLHPATRILFIFLRALCVKCRYVALARHSYVLRVSALSSLPAISATLDCSHSAMSSRPESRAFCGSQRRDRGNTSPTPHKPAPAPHSPRSSAFSASQRYPFPSSPRFSNPPNHFLAYIPHPVYPSLHPSSSLQGDIHGHCHFRHRAQR